LKEFLLGITGLWKVVKHYEEWSALAGCLEACKNTIVNMEIVDFTMAARLMKAVAGWDMDGQEVQALCERVVNLERAFNTREGLSRQDDTLPGRFTDEPLPAAWWSCRPCWRILPGQRLGDFYRTSHLQQTQGVGPGQGGPGIEGAWLHS